ncbi:hypothetical protein OG943_09600 [Amycolatopsis sp. NBC_00345]|uniref:hypothetical protein n=1 Tax=Amycolatopsis sp. NBC_00345 TaxID=2975955 RepID=UPI002E272F21
MTGSVDVSALADGDGGEVSEGSRGPLADQGSADEVVEGSDEAVEVAPLSAGDRIIRENQRQSDIGTAKRRLDDNEHRAGEKEKELREAKAKLEEMGLDEKGKIPRPPGGGDVEAQDPGADPWVVYIWQYCTKEEGEALRTTALAAGLGVISSAYLLAQQVEAFIAARSSEDAAEHRILAGDAPGANSSHDTQLMNDELGDSASQSRLSAMFAPLATIVLGLGSLGAALNKYYSVRLAILARIKEFAKKYEDGSAELNGFRQKMDELNQELDRLGANR